MSLQEACLDKDIDNTDDETDEEAQIDDGVQLVLHNGHDQLFKHGNVHVVDLILDDAVDVQHIQHGLQIGVQQAMDHTDHQTFRCGFAHADRCQSFPCGGFLQLCHLGGDYHGNFYAAFLALCRGI